MVGREEPLAAPESRTQEVRGGQGGGIAFPPPTTHRQLRFEVNPTDENSIPLPWCVKADAEIVVRERPFWRLLTLAETTPR